MTLRLHVFKSLLRLLQWEHLLINHRLDIIRLDRPHHLLKLAPRTDKHPSEGTKVPQSMNNPCVTLGLHATKEANDIDHPIRPDGLDALFLRLGTAHLEDLIHALTVGELAGGFAPVGVLLVVDDVVGTEFLEDFGFFGCRGGCNDSGACGFGELIPCQ